MAVNPAFVLVVEDEALIRLNLVEEFQDAGLTVFEAGSADEALAILDANPHIGAIFSDIDMPGSKSGLDLARIVRAEQPAIAITLTSGYLKLPKGELPSDIDYISKPYDIDHVLKKIRSLVAV